MGNFLTLLLVVEAGEEAGYELGCRLVHLGSEVVEDPDEGSCRRSPFWREARVCCHERGASAQSLHARE